jgi:MoxR-like ATPase
VDESQLRFADVSAVEAALADQRYLADRALATSVYLAGALEQPLLLEGEAGVGKTEVAKALAGATGARLIRLQCHEGMDLHHALYDWDYSRQLLAIRAESGGQLYSREFLLPRPLLEALEHPGPVVLLIDEVDRADDEFEAFLLELLADAAVTIPELGTFRATVPPIVVLTSNRTRDLHDALKRRCLYHWIAYPDTNRVADIIRRRVPAASDPLAAAVAAAVTRLRGLDLTKPPGVAEAINWATALHALGMSTLDIRTADATLGAVLKYAEDTDLVRRAGLAGLIADA